LPSATWACPTGYAYHLGRANGSAAGLKYHIRICICMSSRNIAVQKAVYDGLVREKRPGESFTTVLRRLLDQRRSVEDLAGAWGTAGAKAERVRLQRLRSGGRLP